MVESYVKFSIHVALAVVALALISAAFLEVILPTPLLIFIFSSTLLGYNNIKYGLFPKRRFGALPRGLLWAVNGGALGAAGATFFSLSLPQQALSLFTGVLVLFYGHAFPFQRTQLRTHSSLKLYWVAFCWVCIAVGLPYLEGLQPLSFKLFLWSLQMGLFVVVATLPFELRDMNNDPQRLQTWPQKWGVSSTKKRGALLLLGAFFLVLLIPELSLPLRGSALLTQCFLLIFLGLSHPRRSFYYAALGVEALPLFWWCVYHLFLYLAT